MAPMLRDSGDGECFARGAGGVPSSRVVCTIPLRIARKCSDLSYIAELTYIARKKVQILK
jgi:hypothetical protein